MDNTLIKNINYLIDLFVYKKNKINIQKYLNIILEKKRRLLEEIIKIIRKLCNIKFKLN